MSFPPSGYGLIACFGIHCLYLTCWKAVVYMISNLKDSDYKYLQSRCFIILDGCLVNVLSLLLTSFYENQKAVSTRLVFVKDLNSLVKIKYSHINWFIRVLVLKVTSATKLFLAVK